MEHHKLQLSVRDLEDLSILASLVQDSLLALCDITFLQNEKRFVMVLNRFCWENVESRQAGHYLRTHTALNFEQVTAVQFRDIDQRNQDAIHNLLTLAYDDAEKALVFHFAGGGALRLEMSRLLCQVEDMGESWPTPNWPDHKADILKE